MSTDALSVLAVIGVAVSMIVDGEVAIVVAAILTALALAPDAAYLAGQTAALGVLVMALTTVLTTLLTFRFGALLPLSVAPNPTAPMFSEPNALFGPRSARLAVAVLALPAASWLSFNTALPGVAVGAGILFPAAYTWLCGAGRLLVARTIEDLAIGLMLISVGLALAWATRSETTLGSQLLVFLSVAPSVGAVIGWLGGRQRARKVGV